MTTPDGYPMAQSGNAGRALGLGIGASLIGGLVSWAFLLMLAEPMAAMLHKLGFFEFFSLVAMSMVLIGVAGGGGMAKGLLAGFLGIMASMPGVHPATGQVRLTGGITEMADGFKLLPVLIGLYAVSQVVRDIVGMDRKGDIAATPARRGDDAVVGCQEAVGESPEIKLDRHVGGGFAGDRREYRIGDGVYGGAENVEDAGGIWQRVPKRELWRRKRRTTRRWAGR